MVAFMQAESYVYFLRQNGKLSLFSVNQSNTIDDQKHNSEQRD